MGENANSLAFAIDLLGESIFQLQDFFERALPPSDFVQALSKLNNLPINVIKRVWDYLKSKKQYQSQINFDQISKDPLVLCN